MDRNSHVRGDTFTCVVYFAGWWIWDCFVGGVFRLAGTVWIWKGAALPWTAPKPGASL